MKKLFASFVLFVLGAVCTLYGGVFQTFTADNGLLSNNVVRVEVWDSIVYFQTDKGLQSYDGNFHTLFEGELKSFVVAPNEVYLLKEDGVYTLAGQKVIGGNNFRSIAYFWGNIYLSEAAAVYKYDSNGAIKDTYQISDVSSMKVAGDTLLFFSGIGVYDVDSNLVQSGDVLSLLYLDPGYVYSGASYIKMSDGRVIDNTVGARELLQVRNLLYAAGEYGVRIYRLNDGTLVGQINTQNQLYDNNVTSLVKDSFNNIWIGTAQGGVCLYMPKFDYMTASYNTLGIDTQIAGSIIKKVRYINGNVWLSVASEIDGQEHYKGLSIVDLAHYAVRNVNSANSILPDTVLCFEQQDTTSNVFIGTERGLYMYDVSADSFKYVGLSGHSVSALYFYGDTLYIGAGDTLYSYRTMIDTLYSAGSKIQTLFVDANRSKDLWIGTETGLVQYSIRQDTVIKDWADFKGKSIVSIEEIRGLYIGTKGNGLYQIVGSAVSPVPYGTSSSSFYGLSALELSSYDSKLLCIAAENYGLSFYLQSEGLFTYFLAKDGLLSNKVYSVYAQGDTVFVGTDKGLTLYYLEYTKPILYFKEVPQGDYVVYPESVQRDAAGNATEYKGRVRVEYYGFDYTTAQLRYEIFINSAEPVLTTNYTKGEVNFSLKSASGLVNLEVRAYNRFGEYSSASKVFNIYFFDSKNGTHFKTSGENYDIYVPPDAIGPNMKVGFIDSDTSLTVIPDDLTLDVSIRVEYNKAVPADWGVYRDGVAAPSFIDNGHLVFYINQSGNYEIHPLTSGTDTGNKILLVKVDPRIYTKTNQYIYFHIQTSSSQNLRAYIFDQFGNFVYRLFEGPAADVVNLKWDGVYESGSQVPNGLYILYVDNGRESIKKLFGVRR